MCVVLTSVQTVVHKKITLINKTVYWVFVCVCVCGGCVCVCGF